MEYYFRQIECINRIPTARNTFENMKVYQSEEEANAFISVNECEKRLIYSQFKDLYFNLEKCVLKKIKITNADLIQTQIDFTKNIMSEKSIVEYNVPKYVSTFFNYVFIVTLVYISIFFVYLLYNGGIEYKKESQMKMIIERKWK